MKTMLGYPTADIMVRFTILLVYEVKIVLNFSIQNIINIQHERYVGKQVVAVLRRNADNHYTLCMVDDVTEVNAVDDDEEEEEFIFNEE